MNEQHRLAYRAIKEVSYQHHGGITKLLAIIEVSRQAYNKSFKRVETKWEKQDRLLKQRVQYWFDFHYQRIGAGNLLINLEQDEKITFVVTLKQVRRVMRALNIRCQIRTKKHNRIKQAEQYTQDNLLDQEFTVEQPNQVWLSDSTEVTYGVYGENKVRFSGVLDLYGRRLMAYHLSPTETSKAEIAVFQRAFDAVGEDVHPMIHTDRGSAYTSNEFNDFLEPFKVTRSMSRPGTPYDNAPMERWWNEFKLRWLARHARPKTYEELIQLIEAGIEYFNHQNRSAQRNGLTPDEYWNEAA